MYRVYLCFFVWFCSLSVYSQKRKSENIIVVTLDGMRWQEIFGGADSALLNNKEYTRDPEEASKKFWDNDVNERRKKLFPFIWSTLQLEGQLYGNRWKGNYINNANPYWF